MFKMYDFEQQKIEKNTLTCATGYKEPLD